MNAGILAECRYCILLSIFKNIWMQRECIWVKGKIFIDGNLSCTALLGHDSQELLPEIIVKCIVADEIRKVVIALIKRRHNGKERVAADRIAENRRMRNHADKYRFVRFYRSKILYRNVTLSNQGIAKLRGIQRSTPNFSVYLHCRICFGGKNTHNISTGSSKIFSNE